MPAFDGKMFDALIGSDIKRDGIYFEVSERGRPQPVAEVFYSDAIGAMVLDTFGNQLPLALIEWMIAEAKTRLPPNRDKTPAV